MKHLIGCRFFVQLNMAYQSNGYMYFLMEAMDSDLLSIINSSMYLGDNHVLILTYQMLKGLSFLHESNIIHRDMKPSNLLVNKNWDLKIADFGMSREMSFFDSKDYDNSGSLCTRWYRAPELLHKTCYDSKVDVWSAGCIIIELFNRQVLFPGRNKTEMLTLILNSVRLKKSDMEDIIISLVPFPIDVRYKSLGRCTICFIQKLLKYNRKERITASEALDDQFFHQKQYLLKEYSDDLNMPKYFENSTNYSRSQVKKHFPYLQST